MKKWYDEEYEFTVEVTGFLHGDKTERYCRNGEEIGDKYTCTYGCPVNKDEKLMKKWYDDAVSAHGSCQERRGSGKPWW